MDWTPEEQSQVSKLWSQYIDIAGKEAERQVIEEFESDLASGKIDEEIDQWEKTNVSFLEKILNFFNKK